MAEPELLTKEDANITDSDSTFTSILSATRAFSSTYSSSLLPVVVSEATNNVPDNLGALNIPFAPSTVVWALLFSPLKLIVELDVILPLLTILRKEYVELFFVSEQFAPSSQSKIMSPVFDTAAEGAYIPTPDISPLIVIVPSFLTFSASGAYIPYALDAVTVIFPWFTISSCLPSVYIPYPSYSAETLILPLFLISASSDSTHIPYPWLPALTVMPLEASLEILTIPSAVLAVARIPYPSLSDSTLIEPPIFLIVVLGEFVLT